MNCFVIRGAITVEANTKDQIIQGAKELLTEILRVNDLEQEQIIQISFTATKDLDQAYPAIGARELGITDAALMCMQEMWVEGSLRQCIRVALMCQGTLTQKTVKHCYLKEAQKLRPDLLSK
ncbi:MAG: chorismate mutase [Cellulosilyticaceae bacterium]